MFSGEMLLSNTSLILFSFYVLIPISVNGYTLDDVTRLKKWLFQDYDVGVRPIFNQSLPVDVGVELILRSIVQVDMTNGQIHTMGYMLAHWFDERMTWAGTEFDDIPSISLKGDELWHPHIIQMNAMADEVQESSIILSKDGYVVRIVVRQYYTFCSLNMRYYPNDEHECTFQFVSAKHGHRELNMYSIFGEIEKKLLSPHGEWVIGETYSEKRDLPFQIAGFSAENLEFTMKLQRMPLFNTIHRSVPLGILAFGSLFAHAIPLNCGERISYVVTILLALVFWQSLVAEELPKNSSKISIVSIVLTAVLCLSGLCTILSIYLVRIASYDSGKPIPAFLQRLTRKFRQKKKRKNHKNNEHGEDHSQDHISVDKERVRGHRHRDSFPDCYPYDRLDGYMSGSFDGHGSIRQDHYRHRNESSNSTLDDYLQDYKIGHRHQNDHRNDNAHGVASTKKGTSNGHQSGSSIRSCGKDSDSDARSVTWLEVADALDRVFFIIHAIAVFLIAIAFVLIFVVDVDV